MESDQGVEEWSTDVKKQFFTRSPTPWFATHVHVFTGYDCHVTE